MSRHSVPDRFAIRATPPTRCPSGVASRRTLGWIGRAVVVLALAAGTSAGADSGSLMPRNVPDAYMQECASCHAAYPPGLLPARSWQRLIEKLDQHFGSDATLDAITQQQIDRWLQSNAGTYKRVKEEPPQDRITRSAWFGRKHRKIDPSVWQLSSVKSAANCAACHTGTDRGVFDDDQLKVPEGMNARLRGPWND